MRGEHRLAHPELSDSVGSSPHARGTRIRDMQVGGLTGIIPACAGNTGVERIDATVERDHPRMRGEHQPDVAPVVHEQGSSPHARGTHRHTLKPQRFRGIIPACAGNTRVYPMVSRGSRDHPRMRGEHLVCSRHCTIRTGSSPHARGTPGMSEGDSSTLGIIPACAGNTL